MTQEQLSSTVSSIRVDISSLQQACTSLLEIAVSAVPPGTLEASTFKVPSEVIPNAAGQLGIAHYYLGYYKEAMDTDKMAESSKKEIKSLSDITAEVDRVDKHYAIMDFQGDRVLTSAYELVGYVAVNRFGKIAFCLDYVQGFINKVLELPVEGNELARIYKEHAIANLTLAKALFAEHYQELLEISTRARNVQIKD